MPPDKTPGPAEIQHRGLELKVPPLMVVIVAAVLMWLISRSLPQFRVSFPARRLLATAFAFAGFITAASGVLAFRRSKTTVNPMKPASATSLVVSGIYTTTRNPMYLGFLLLLAG